MKRPKILRVAGRTSAALAVVGFGLTPFAGMAFAGTPSTASANAVTVTSLPITTGTETATNNGNQPTQIVGDQPAISILAGETSLTVGVLQQTSTAAQGASYACAGLSGNQSEIQVGSDGVCTFGTGEAGGITLGGPQGIVINLAVETCQADSSGTTFTDQLIGLSVGGQAQSIPPGPIPVNDELIPGLIELNRQVTDPATGVTTATALYDSALSISIGNVSCSTGATTGVSSAFPTESWPIVLATLVVMGLVYLGWSQRRQRRSQAAA